MPPGRGLNANHLDIADNATPTSFSWVHHKLPDGRTYHTSRDPFRIVTDIDVGMHDAHKIVDTYLEQMSFSEVAKVPVHMELWVRLQDRAGERSTLPVGVWIDHKSRVLQPRDASDEDSADKYKGQPDDAISLIIANVPNYD